RPDPATLVIDPFMAQPTAVVICDVVEPSTGEGYGRDPRTLARRAESYVKYSGIGDTAYFGPEPEFFMFDDVRFQVGYNGASYSFDDIEGPYNSNRAYDEGNMGHRPRIKGGYFPVAPVDACQDIRSEMVAVARGMGLPMDKHHHEVAASQHEL